VAEPVEPHPFVEPLGAHHDRAAFSCGVAALDRYFREQASQDARRFIAAPFALVTPGGAVGGYYTLSATSIQLAELPPETVRRLPRYPLVPAFLLGRLAVDQRYRGQGWGRFLLVDALHRCLMSEITGFAVIVDAKDDAARRFYERESFLPLPDTPRRLFRRLADIAAVFRDSP
jgi:GNAT superfamily N-acetyltransferase